MFPSNSRGTSATIPEYLWRVFHLPHMDFQRAGAYMVLLATDPKEAYRNTRMYKVICHRWARDDPAFLVLLAGLMALSSVAYAIAFRITSPWYWIRTILGSILLELVLTGIIVATVLRWAVNTYIRNPRSNETVEWLYGFDVHCNAFFIYFIITYVVQFFLLPFVLLPHRLLAVVLANSLYAVAFTAYIYLTWLGYSTLPFLHERKAVSIMRVAFLVCGTFVVMTLLKFNFSTYVFDMYFGE